MTTSWTARSACKDVPPSELDWFSSNSKDKYTARNICQTKCPVRRSCIEYALNEQIIHGIWGGVDEYELRSAMACDQYGEPAQRSRLPRCPFCLSRKLKISGARTKKGYKTECTECGLVWRMLAIPEGVKRK